MIVYFIFLVFVILWLGIIFLCPYLYSLPHFPKALILLIYMIFKLICHQKPERSYFIFGAQLPVCARCLGIYVGLLLGACIYPIFKKLNDTKIPDFKYIGFGIIPIFVDGISQVFHLYPSPAYIRFITGCIASTVLVFYLLPVQNQIYNKIISK